MSRAALYDETGGPEVLYVGTVDDAPPAPERVAVRVRAAGLNPFDSKVRSGARVPPLRTGAGRAQVRIDVQHRPRRVAAEVARVGDQDPFDPVRRIVAHVSSAFTRRDATPSIPASPSR